MDKADFQNAIGRRLFRAVRKGYGAGIKFVTDKNKRLFFEDGEAIIVADDRELFSVDYSITDLHALHNFRVEAFTVAGVGSFELEERLKELATQVWRDKQQDTGDFLKRARKIISQYNPKAGAPPGGWLATNLNTAVGSSYHAGQWLRVTDPDLQGIYKAFKYTTRGDSKVRDEHRELEGQVFEIDNPVLDYIYPPNDWNCRCSMIPLTLREMQRETLSGLTPDEVKGNVAPDFRRNPGKEKSIWGKWLSSAFKDTPLDKINLSLKKYVGGGVPEKLLTKYDTSREILRDINKSKVDPDINLHAVADAGKLNVILNVGSKHKALAKDVVSKPTEIWGRSLRSKGIRSSEIYYLKFSKDGVVIITVRDGVFQSIKSVSYKDVEKYRRGTLIYKDFG